MAEVFIKASAVWLIIVVAAIINGLLRDAMLTPMLGRGLSLPVSGLTLSVLVFLVTYLFIDYIGVTQPKACFLVGLLWLVLTLLFEYLFGHYVMGKSWAEINQVFNLAKGDLFLIVLVISVISPWLSAKFKALI